MAQYAIEAIYSPEWTIRRIERAEGGLKPLTVKSYDDVLPPWFRVAVGLEESACLIRAYEPQVVPGLLQTEGYVRAITAASFPAAPQEFTERAVALRLARQQLLTRPEPPEYWVVLDETVLRRPIGGHKVMHARLRHLIQAAEQPKITIQGIPFAAGWHLALKLPGGRVALRQSTDPDGPALILESGEIRAFVDGAKAGLADDLLT